VTRSVHQFVTKLEASSAAASARAIDHFADEPVGLKSPALERLDANDRDVRMILPHAVELDFELEIEVGVDDNGDAGSKLCIRQRGEDRTNGAASPLDARHAKCTVDDTRVEMRAAKTTCELRRERRACRTMAGRKHEDHVVARLHHVEPVSVTNAVQHATHLRKADARDGIASPERHQISTER
jgi:hypothetical protein